jgi:hypothetical protein
LFSFNHSNPISQSKHSSSLLISLHSQTPI